LAFEGKKSKKEFNQLKGLENFDQLQEILQQMMSISKQKTEKFYDPFTQNYQTDLDFYIADDDKPKRAKMEFGSTTDIDLKDRANLMRSGFDEILKNPTTNIVS
jgi:hypothetical protein